MNSDHGINRSTMKIILMNITFFIFLFSFFISGYAQVIENLDFVQEGKNIRITYDLIGSEENQLFDVSVYYSSDGGKTWYGPLREIVGHVGSNQTAGNNLSITWDVLAEKKSLVGEVQFKIEARVFDNNFGKSEIVKETPSRRNYIGISLGPSIPIGDFANNDFSPGSGFAKTGANLNLINFGYLITKNFGITANIGVLFHGNKDNTEVWNCISMMFGPLISFPANNFSFDIRGSVGYLGAIPPHISKNNVTIMDGKLAPTITINMGIGTRLHVNNKISVMILMDYQYGKFEVNSDWEDNVVKFQVFNISGGIAFRLK